MTKYHAKPTEVSGIRFDSRAEATRYQELCLLQKAGQINSLQVHPRYMVWQHFDEIKKRMEKIEYEGDFSYVENGQEVVEDVKGVRTAIFCLKKKMFLASFPKIKFVELNVR